MTNVRFFAAKHEFRIIMAGEAGRKPGFVPCPVTRNKVTVIYLGLVLPPESSGPTRGIRSGKPQAEA